MQYNIEKLSDGDFLILVGNLPAKQLGGFYQRRWSIEVFFQSANGRGFNLENTHLKSSKKIKKLITFVSIAVGICMNIGNHYHKKVPKIKLINMGINPIVFYEMGLMF